MPYKDQFRRAIGAYLGTKRHLSPETQYQERRWLLKAAELLDGKNPKDLTVGQLCWFETQVPGGVDNRKNHCYALSRLLKWLGNPVVNQWVIQSRPTPKVDGTFLNEREVAYLRGSVRSAGPLHELIYSLGVDNGLRAVGMCRLTVDQGNALLRSGRGTVLGKGRNGGKPRLLPMSEMTFQPLTEYLVLRRQLLETYGPTQTDRLLIFRNFQTGRLQTMTHDHIYWRMKPLFESVGYGHLTVHDLRRTFGNRHWKAGTPIETIAKLMGHESVNQTFRAYIGIQFGDMQNAQENLSRVAKMNPSSHVQSP
ncbi:MAG TPA: site-specific integrase [Methanomassiliicoccales archaeon]|nr:site-specific integrase [Methanomassiliicoccales archaeon]